jgi:hypothetical protein
MIFNSFVKKTNSFSGIPLKLSSFIVKTEKSVANLRKLYENHKYDGTLIVEYVSGVCKGQFYRLQWKTPVKGLKGISSMYEATTPLMYIDYEMPLSGVNREHKISVNLLDRNDRILATICFKVADFGEEPRKLFNNRNIAFNIVLKNSSSSSSSKNGSGGSKTANHSPEDTEDFEDYGDVTHYDIGSGSNTPNVNEDDDDGSREIETDRYEGDDQILRLMVKQEQQKFDKVSPSSPIIIDIVKKASSKRGSTKEIENIRTQKTKIIAITAKCNTFIYKTIMLSRNMDMIEFLCKNVLESNYETLNTNVLNIVNYIEENKLFQERYDENHLVQKKILMSLNVISCKKIFSSNNLFSIKYLERLIVTLKSRYPVNIIKYRYNTIFAKFNTNGEIVERRHFENDFDTHIDESIPSMFISELVRLLTESISNYFMDFFLEHSSMLRTSDLNNMLRKNIKLMFSTLDENKIPGWLVTSFAYYFMENVQILFFNEFMSLNTYLSFKTVMKVEMFLYELEGLLSEIGATPLPSTFVKLKQLMKFVTLDKKKKTLTELENLFPDITYIFGFVCLHYKADEYDPRRLNLPVDICANSNTIPLELYTIYYVDNKKYNRNSMSILKPSPQFEYYTVDVKPDGNCQFRAFAKQFEGNEDNHMYYRAECVKWLRKNERYAVGNGSTFINYIDLKIFSSWREFCDKMALDGTWGDQITLIGLANAFHCRLHVYTTKNNQVVMIECYDKNVEKDIYLLYIQTGYHYMSLYPLK